MKNELKNAIIQSALDAQKYCEAAIASLSAEVSIEKYRHLTRQSRHGLIWTYAF